MTYKCCEKVKNIQEKTSKILKILKFYRKIKNIKMILQTNGTQNTVGALINTHT